MKRISLLIAAAISAAAMAQAGYSAPAEAQPTPAKRDPAKLGQALFLQCSACHATTADEAPKVGPHLAGIMGRKAAAVEGYSYSKAMQDSDIVWDHDRLDQFLMHPSQVVPGTSMAFGGISAEQQRDAMIAYLETLH